jgi:hypothetical protein
MAKMYLPVIAPKDYEAFRKILKDEIPSNYAEWRRDVDKCTGHSRIQSLKWKLVRTASLTI